MRILVSAFACLPRRGSEAGVGWEWPKALAEMSDHEVTVVTQSNNRDAIEAHIAQQGISGVRFRYVEFDSRLRRSGSLGHYMYYYLWQVRLLIDLLRTGEWRQFDVIHHLTYGGIRAWSLLFLLPRPFMFGPVGGGETAPARLSKRLGWTRMFVEQARSMLNLFARVDPILLLMQLRAFRVLAKTPASARCLVLSRTKVHVSIEIGAPRNPIPRPTRPLGATFRVLFAGRLLYWKGCDFVVDAMKLLEADECEMELVIIGDGERRPNIAKKVSNLSRIRVTMTGQIPQNELFEHYQRADLFVFPSLHDSSGNVVLEAMTFGLPVVCFDLGGPPLVACDAGIVVAVEGADYDEACGRLATAIRALRDDPVRREALSTVATRRASHLTWQEAVRAGYGPLLASLRSPELPADPSLSAERRA